MASEAGFKGPQVCSIVGITYRQLDYWARTDLLRPSLADAKGSGSQRRYSYQDLLELKVIKQLLDAGVKLQEARRALACIRESGGDVATANLVLGAQGTVLARSGEEVVDLLRGGQGVFNIVPLAGVVGEINAAILRFEDSRRDKEAAGAPFGVGTPAESGSDGGTGHAAEAR